MVIINNYFTEMLQKRGFTLSEILIVLCLIGVTALILVPFLMRTFQKEKWTTTYKRTFSETYQALTLMALEEDCAKSLTCTGAFGGTLKESTNNFGKLFSSRMKVKTNCGITTDGGQCFSHKVLTLFRTTNETQNTAETIKETLTKNPVPKEGDPSGENLQWGDLPFPYTFVNARGVSYALFSFGTDCLKSNSAEEDTERYLGFYVRRANDEDVQISNDNRIPKDDSENQMLNLCGFIVIDVNGSSKPNVWGKDVFGLWITDTKTLGVYSFGGASDRLFYKKCKSTGSPSDMYDGRGCAARIVEDNWSMRYLND